MKKPEYIENAIGNAVHVNGIPVKAEDYEEMMDALIEVHDMFIHMNKNDLWNELNEEIEMIEKALKKAGCEL